ncbi:MAG: hypothetical protein M3R38_18835 [Actinomycetota bacterium]|nr:hypothetical protein [Actinomycetota bacterium]
MRLATLLDQQLRLLEVRREDVADLLARDGRHDEVLVDCMANDFVGAPRDLRGSGRAVPRKCDGSRAGGTHAPGARGRGSPACRVGASRSVLAAGEPDGASRPSEG